MIRNHNTSFKKLFAQVLLLQICLFYSINIYAWGFYAHKRINHLAIFTLPPEMNRLYKRHVRAIESLAVLPDQRRHSMDEEAARHYIDLDQYKLEDIQYLTYEKAIQIYSKDSLSLHGIVPWIIPTMKNRLKYAFLNRDTLQIIKLSAELGHYIADAHVPLHTTSNYDGQKTNQVGIHAFWESYIPEMLQRELEKWATPAHYIADLQKETWDWILHAHGYVHNLLLEEAKLNANTKPQSKYIFTKKGILLTKTYAPAYAKVYHSRLNHQIEHQFNESIQHIGNVWYSAWLEAGQPDFK
jgi:hypothetical protein